MVISQLPAIILQLPKTQCLSIANSMVGIVTKKKKDRRTELQVEGTRCYYTKGSGPDSRGSQLVFDAYIIVYVASLCIQKPPLFLVYFTNSSSYNINELLQFLGSHDVIKKTRTPSSR